MTTGFGNFDSNAEGLPGISGKQSINDLLQRIMAEQNSSASYADLVRGTAVPHASLADATTTVDVGGTSEATPWDLVFTPSADNSARAMTQVDTTNPSGAQTTDGSTVNNGVVGAPPQANNQNFSDARPPVDGGNATDLGRPNYGNIAPGALSAVESQSGSTANSVSGDTTNSSTVNNNDAITGRATYGSGMAPGALALSRNGIGAGGIGGDADRVNTNNSTTNTDAPQKPPTAPIDPDYLPFAKSMRDGIEQDMIDHNGLQSYARTNRSYGALTWSGIRAIQGTINGTRKGINNSAYSYLQHSEKWQKQLVPTAEEREAAKKKIAAADAKIAAGEKLTDAEKITKADRALAADIHPTKARIAGGLKKGDDIASWIETKTSGKVGVLRNKRDKLHEILDTELNAKDFKSIRDKYTEEYEKLRDEKHNAILAREGRLGGNVAPSREADVIAEEITKLEKSPEAAKANRYNYLNAARTGKNAEPFAGLHGIEESDRTLIKDLHEAQFDLDNAATKKGVIVGALKSGLNLAVAAGGTALVDNIIDRMTVGSDKASKYDSPTASLVPGMVLKWGSEKPGLTILGTSAIYGLGRVEQFLYHPDNDSAWNRWLKTTPTDTAFATAASFIPIANENIYTRLGVMAGAAVLGKELNYVREGTPVKVLRDQAVGSLNKITANSSANDMHNSIDYFKNMAQDSQAGKMELESCKRNWLSGTYDGESKDHPTQLRGAAILLAASGESILEHGTYAGINSGDAQDSSGVLGKIGTLFSTTWGALGHNDTNADNILMGANLDLGGHATKDLLNAKIELGRVQKDGDLKGVENRIDASLKKVTGEHNIPALLNQTKEWAFAHRTQANSLAGQVCATALNEALKRDKGNPVYRAKLERDASFISLAMAGQLADHGGDQKTVKLWTARANCFLKMAAVHSKDHPDYLALQQTYADLSTKTGSVV